MSLNARILALLAPHFAMTPKEWDKEQARRDAALQAFCERILPKG